MYFRADRAELVGRLAAKLSIAFEFDLSITDLLAVDIAAAQFGEHPSSLETVVDLARGVARRVTATNTHVRRVEQSRPYTNCVPSSAPSWHRYSTAFPSGRSRPIDHVELGPNLADTLGRRLLGDVADKRVLELGTGMGHSAIAMALQGAKVLGIDPDPIQLEHARELAEEQETKVELHQADLADLAFVRNESVDLVVSIHALAAVEDLDRVFRQAHRVLKADMPFVLSLPHPAASLVDPFSDDELHIARGYFEPAILGSGPSLTYRHLIGEVFSGLIRANFRVDTLIENPYTDKPSLPETLVFRAKKVGN